MFNKGEILIGEHRGQDQAQHPIIFIDQIDEVFFIGCMLTHRKRGNVELNEEHFEEIPNNDDRNCFFVNRLLLKEHEWGPFEIAGRLSGAGIEYLERNLAQDEPISWEDAIQNA